MASSEPLPDGRELASRGRARSRSPRPSRSRSSRCGAAGERREGALTHPYCLLPYERTSPPIIVRSREVPPAAARPSEGERQEHEN
jgi:hypothetical protein